MKPFVITVVFIAAASESTVKTMTAKNFHTIVWSKGRRRHGRHGGDSERVECRMPLWISPLRTSPVQVFSPIVVTTALLLVSKRLASQDYGCARNTNANGTWSTLVLTPTTSALWRRGGQHESNADYTSGGTIASTAASTLHFPAGTYNISSPLVTGCPLTLVGDGPTASIIFQTHQYSLIHGIVANYSLSMDDIAVNTTRLLWITA